MYLAREASLGPFSVSVSLSPWSLQIHPHPTETQRGAGPRWGWGPRLRGVEEAEREGTRCQRGQHGGGGEGGEGGRKGVRGRAQQLGLRGDRCFLTGSFWALTHPGDLLAPGMAPVALLETATNHHNDSNDCGASFARRLTSPAHTWQPSTLTTITGTAISPIPQVQHRLVQSPAQGHEPSKRGARLTLSPEPTQNQRPGPLPQFSPRLLLGRGRSLLGQHPVPAVVEGRAPLCPFPTWASSGPRAYMPACQTG